MNCSCNQYIDSFSIDKIGFDFDFNKNWSVYYFLDHFYADKFLQV